MFSELDTKTVVKPFFTTLYTYAYGTVRLSSYSFLSEQSHFYFSHVLAFKLMLKTMSHRTYPVVDCDYHCPSICFAVEFVDNKCQLILLIIRTGLHDNLVETDVFPKRGTYLMSLHSEYTCVKVSLLVTKNKN